MARKREGERVLGPYFEPDKGRWRVIVVEDGGKKHGRFYPSEKEARQVVRWVMGELLELERMTVMDAIDTYETYLRTDKENRPKSYVETLRRLRVFFEDMTGLPIRMLDEKRCAALYEAFRGRSRKDGKPISVD